MESSDGLEPSPAEDHTFREHYIQHRSAVRIFLDVVLRGTGVDREGVAMTAWEKVWRKWRQDPPAIRNVRAYAKKCAYHAAMDALKVDKEEVLSGEEVLHSGTADNADLLDLLRDSVDQQQPEEALTDPRLISAMGRLTPIERAVLLMWAETNPPPLAEEIAQKLGIGSTSTVGVHKSRGLKKLRAFFGVTSPGPKGAEGKVIR